MTPPTGTRHWPTQRRHHPIPQHPISRRGWGHPGLPPAAPAAGRDRPLSSRPPNRLAYGRTFLLAGSGRRAEHGNPRAPAARGRASDRRARCRHKVHRRCGRIIMTAVRRGVSMRSSARGRPGTMRVPGEVATSTSRRTRDGHRTANCCARPPPRTCPGHRPADGRRPGLPGRLGRPPRAGNRPVRAHDRDDAVFLGWPGRS